MKRNDTFAVALDALRSRRSFVREAAIGTTIAALGGLYYFAEPAAGGEAAPRPDGRPRVPPGQRVLQALKPMGGEPGSALRQDFKLAIGGEVEQPLQLDFAGLTAVGVTELALDVHCVTGWSVLGARFKGVRLAELVARVRPKPSARHVIFEAAHGYTANVPLREALKPDVLLAFELDGQALASRHGAPVRAVVPDLYFWKSAKWLTGIRFMTRDEPGFWEVRGYNNHGDPWLEERYG
ncbi:MAG TPA: molybdopterin-dependent oxidoreductase [Polyangiaceae bacterium]|nr:molybdopterin-dependent oxidoreductase [Polyangiaceae bacterium]